MALEGSLTDFGLADILQLIYFQRKTGVLTLEGRMDRVKLTFIDGCITGAESRKRFDYNRIGKILLKKGYIKDTELQTALDEQQRTGIKLGHILLQKELVEKEILTDILKSQTTETVIQLFGWKHGSYEFTSQGVPQDRDLAFSLDTQHLLMEGLRIIDEWSVIKGKITLDMLFTKNTESPGYLTEDEKNVFSYVDGENDVSTIIDLSGKDNFSVSKTLLGLMEKGFIAAGREMPAVAEETVAPARRPSHLMHCLTLAMILLSLVVSLLMMLAGKENVFRNFRAAEQIGDLRFRIETYRLEHSTYPETLDLISREHDPWGRPYLYRASGDMFSLISLGPDGQEGTPDDIY
jgi:hypothetical protein